MKRPFSLFLLALCFLYSHLVYGEDVKIPQSGIHVLGEDLSTDESFKVENETTEYEKLTTQQGYVQDAIPQDKEYPKDLLSKNLENFKRPTREHFGVHIYKDDYKYYNPSQNFNKIFRSAKGTAFPKFFRIKYQYLYLTKIGYWGIGGAGGLSFFRGKSYFVDGSKSQAEFRFYNIPLDAFASYHLPFWKDIVLFSLSAGPSINTLIQNRSDLARYRPKRNLYVVGLGYFTELELKLNLSKMYTPKNEYSVFDTHKVSRYFISFHARMTEVNKFKSKVYRVTGNSFGAGFTYEFF